MPNEIKTWIVHLKTNEDIRIKAEMPVVDGLNAIKFMTHSNVVARFENSEMRFYYEEGDNVERNITTTTKKTRSRTKTSD